MEKILMSQKIIYNCDNCGVELDRNGQILSAHSLDELQSQLCEQQFFFSLYFSWMLVI